MFNFRRYIDLITEASYDAQRDAIIRQFPDREQEIQAHTKWASQNLKKGDRIAWYLRILRAHLADQLTPQVTGEYNFTSMEQLQHDLTHFYGFTNPDGSVDAAIDAYQYQRQPIGDLIRELKQLEERWKNKQKQEKGIELQPGDQVIFKFKDGLKWVYTNRAYCADEGRSGLHCGNVVGQHKPDQRILSLRNSADQVILTFIREPDGSLGEMKAKGNQKPNEQYHPHIMTLLMWDQITGISGMGYLPEMNFSVFDLNEQNLNYLDQHKPKLISDQAGITPFELLKVDVPANIKQKYLRYAEQKQPAITRLINSNTYDQWAKEIETKKDLIFYLPSEYITKFPNYLVTLIEQAKNGNNVLRIPKIVSRNFEYMKEIVAEIPRAIGLTNRHAKGYAELCKIAVTKDYNVMSLIDEELRTAELYKLAVTSNGMALEIIPDQLKTKELYKIAVTSNGMALKYVPKSIQQADPKLYKLAVTSNGMALKYVPKSIQQADPKLYKLAVTHDGMALRYVPNDVQQTYPELYKLAVTSNGLALELVPDPLKTKELCKIAVNHTGEALRYVPTNVQQASPELCKIAITHDGMALRYVPNDVQQTYPELYKLAVTSNGLALELVPDPLKTKELCKIAVNHTGEALRYVPTNVQQAYPELCKIAITHDGMALRYVPDKIILKYPELSKRAFADNPATFRFIPAQHRKENMFRSAVAANGLSLEVIPKPMRTLELCELAISQDSAALQFVPEKIIEEHPRLAEIAYQDDPYSILYMPGELAASHLEDCLTRLDPSDMDGDYFYEIIISKIPPNKEHYKMLARHGGEYALMHIPERYRTLEICELAMEWGDVDETIKYVPDHLRHHFED